MKKAELAESLAEAGLKLCASGDSLSGQLSVDAAWLATSCSQEDGRRDIVVSQSDPDLVEKANAAWFQLASDGGLLGADREFLVGVDFADRDEIPILRWVRVQLMDEWDIVGAGAASGILGWAYGRPGFAMLSLDGSVVVRGTVWAEAVGLLLVPFPHRVQIIRSYVERVVLNPNTSSYDRAVGETWLRRHP
ncbi:hypothetical protein F0L68_23730 [Solihabitans fulvus]|uniref:Uncharacterized protein n=1 Tax=Solihabitans fulvus TaxID=1892852 RepID=A0A5B2X7H1_9PSEU|nr:hypothetical protein [Solihabitans fulvus]KAA2258832.1 hypothetical protein F0L68_23730 [Solihabitans fulvus]